MIPMLCTIWFHASSVRHHDLLGNHVGDTEISAVLVNRRF